MKKDILVVLAALSFSLSGLAQGTWSSGAQKELPLPLQKIKIKKTTKTHIKKILGKPDLVEKQVHYYGLGGFKYSLQIVYDKNAVKEFTYTFTDKKPPFNPEVLNIDLSSTSRLPASSYKDGRYYEYSDKDGDLTIDLISKTLYSIRIK